MENFQLVGLKAFKRTENGLYFESWCQQGGSAMPITKEEVAKIAHLARLEFTPDELENFTLELSKILDYFEELKEVDTSKVLPTFHPFTKRTPFREDEVKEFEDIEALLRNAPELKEGAIVVPKVVKAP